LSINSPLHRTNSTFEMFSFFFNLIFFDFSNCCFLYINSINHCIRKMFYYVEDQHASYTSKIQTWEKKFDWITMVDVLHDLPNPDPLLSWKRVLKDAGVVSAIDPAFHSEQKMNVVDLKAPILYVFSTCCCLPCIMSAEPAVGSVCGKICQWLATGRWFSLGPAVSSNNKTDHHDITEILLKVALNSIKQTNKHIWYSITLHKIRPHAEVIYSYLFKYTQQHTAGFTENNIVFCTS
jgi:hypothetical protein